MACAKAILLDRVRDLELRTPMRDTDGVAIPLRCYRNEAILRGQERKLPLYSVQEAGLGFG